MREARYQAQKDHAVIRAALRKTTTEIEAAIVTALPGSIVTRRGGRVKVYASLAAKQKAYRERKKATQ
jgi:hypothetical protein